jgi:hypothetical protein
MLPATAEAIELRVMAGKDELGLSLAPIRTMHETSSIFRSGKFATAIDFCRQATPPAAPASTRCHAHRTFRELAQRTEGYFSAVTEEFRPNKKEGKRPGLNQYHFPGCVLEVIKILDVNGGKRLP